VGENSTGHKERAPTLLFCTKREVHILHKHEVVLIEAADGSESLLSNHQAGSGEPIDDSRLRALLRPEVSRCPWIGLPQVSEKSVADADANSGKCSSGGIGRPIFIQQAGTSNSHSGSGDKFGYQRFEGVWLPHNIWVTDDEKIWSISEDGHSVVCAGAIARVVGAVRNGHREFWEGWDGCGKPGRVFDNHNFIGNNCGPRERFTEFRPDLVRFITYDHETQ